MSGISKANQRQGVRRKKYYTSYANSQQREKSKACKLAKHLKKHPNELNSKVAFKNLPVVARQHAKRKLVLSEEFYTNIMN